MKIGDRVRVLRIPAGVPEDNKQLISLFKGSIGKDFVIAGIDDDLIELHVGEAFGKPAEYHQIWIEPNCVRLLEA